MHTSQSWKICTAKLQKETEYKQQKIIVRKLNKKFKMQHYHEALNKPKIILKTPGTN